MTERLGRKQRCVPPDATGRAAEVPAGPARPDSLLGSFRWAGESSDAAARSCSEHGAFAWSPEGSRAGFQGTGGRQAEGAGPSPPLPALGSRRNRGTALEPPEGEALRLRRRGCLQEQEERLSLVGEGPT